MGDNEEYFPRGGKKPTSVRFKQSSNFLGGITQEDRKKKKSKKATENDDGYLSDELVTEVVDNSYKNCGLWLNYKVVREGLLMLGRVQEVMETKLMISLPCRMQGMVMACHISEAYNQQLEAYVNDKIEEVSDLSKMFHRGQYVIVKVLEVTPNNQLMLSLMPQHINSGKMHSELRKGTIVQAAVTSVEDHGYIMDIGVPNTKVFLPKDSANSELELVPGGVCWCGIKSVSASPGSSVVTLSGDLQYLQRAVQRHSAHNSALMPGTALEFTVDKPLDNGIEGHVLDNVTAYIQRHQVDSGGKKPTLGQKIRARLLYCIPPNNIPYLTMKGVFDATRPDLQEEQKLNAGDFVEEAQVMKIMGKSVYMKLADKELGLLSLRRIQVDENLSDSDVVAKSYPVGSIHKVRVLCYHLADHLYSVSDDRRVLAEKYFSLAELQAGQFVSATVAEVADTCLRVNVGRLKGVIPLSHMTETGIFLDPKKASASTLPKKKFKVGQELRGRVLQVDTEKHKLALTLKPSLLQPDLEPLASYEQAQVGKVYTGVVKCIRDYLLVSFFNDVIAYVPRNFVTSEPVDNLADAFHLAQIVKCTILSVKVQEKRMSASLTTAPFDPEAKRNSVKRQSEDVNENESAENKKKRKKKNKNAKEETDNIDEENKASSEESSSHRVREELQAGQFVSATVAEVADNFLRVDVGWLKGIIPLSHMTETGKLDSKKANASTLSKKKFKVGQEVRGRVLQVDTEKHKLVLTLKPSLLQPDLEPLASYEQAQVGKAYTGVVKYIRDYLLVSFFNDVIAYVPRIFVTSEPVDNLADAFHLAQIVQCTILSVKPQEKKMSASLTTAPFDPEAKRNPVKRQNEDTKIRNGKKANLENKQMANDVDENETHHENGENKNKKRKKESKKFKEETDDIEKASSEESDAIETDFHDEQQVLVPAELNLIDFSDCVTEKKLKKRVVSLLKAIKARTHRLKRVEEKITKIETKGLDATNKKFHTAMHMEKLVLKERIGKLTDALEEGQNKLKELNIEFKIDKKIKLQKTKEKDDVEPVIPQKKNRLREKETEEVKDKRVETKEKRKEQKEHREVKSKEISVLDSLQPVVQVPSIKDFWLGNVDNISGVVDNKDEESSSSDEEEEEKPKKKRKKLSPAEKVAKAREEEQRIRDMEKRAIESEAQPRSNEQFQRALLANPDSSQLWIAYMAFHLQATEIEKARAMARKALATINFREEQERLNVWLALLNLEHRFGNKESQQKTLEDALQMNDTYKVHTKLLDILVDTGKSQELSSVVELMLRRYRGSADVYRAAGAACYSAGLLDKARQVMQKGLAALEKKEHVTLLVNFAKLERSAGERERSEALFEQVLAVYPQRVDVASVYLDVLLKSGLVDQARQVLERLTSLQLPARKMKVLYKKWIEIEERNGDDAHIQSIRQRAKDFLDKAKF